MASVVAIPRALGGGGAGVRVEGLAAPLGRPARRGARRVHVVRPFEECQPSACLAPRVRWEKYRRVVVGKWVGCDRQSPLVS